MHEAGNYDLLLQIVQDVANHKQWIKSVLLTDDIVTEYKAVQAAAVGSEWNK